MPLTLFRHVEFAMNRVRMLLYFGVTPYLVFDGDNLPSKAGTEADRAKRREESKRLGLELYKAGKTSQAHQELQKAVDVTPHMARQLIEELKILNIQYVVAPYEADAQLVYLERKGIINGILSEDSDLLVFGAKRLLTKLDPHGDCIEINRNDFGSCRDISLLGWTDADFRRMAILSGCDYLPSINKMGLKTAYRYVRKYKSVDKVLRLLQFEGHYCVPADYLERFQRAELTFLHHRVFCPIEKTLVFLTELERGTHEEDMPYLGKNVEPETAIGVACGDLDPMTKKTIVVRGIPSSSKLGGVAPRRQTLAFSADLKSSKSLESFLKPRRQPLAELDPNSLTPSPSQQRVLEMNANASWVARTVSSAPQLRSHSASLTSARRASRVSSQTVERAAFLERAATISSYQQPKRPRLCSDVGDASPIEGARTSPYFASGTEQPSPSLRKKGRGKKARKSDFDVYSDDSVDAILLELQATNETVTYPEINTLAEESTVESGKLQPEPQSEPASCEDLEAVPESSPSRLPDHAFVQLPLTYREGSLPTADVPSQCSPTQKTSATFVQLDGEPEAFKDLLEYHHELQQKTFLRQSPERQAAALAGLPKMSIPTISRAPTLSLEKTFSYQSSSLQASALNSLRQGQGDEDKVKLGLEALSTIASSKASRKLKTPLQQLGERALRKTKSELGVTTARVHDEPPVDIGYESDGGPPLVVGKLLVQLKGSEDLLVPNSDEEGDDTSETEQRPSGFWKNLGKYAFTPK